jgi:hypothetical protein
MRMTTRKRHSPEQVVRKLAHPDRMLGEGKDVADVCRELQVSEQTTTGGGTSSAGCRPTTPNGSRTWSGRTRP